MRTPPPVSAFWRTLASAAAAVLALVAPARADIDLDAIKPDGFARGVAFTVAGYTNANGTARSPLAGVPVLVRISSAIKDFDYDERMFSSSEYADAVRDVAFVDDEGNGLAYEIDTWNPAGESLVWVNLPSMANGTQFAMFYRWSNSGKTVCADNPFAA